ncbi:MAG: tRNA (adenosine(37)-N6)-threonylcarbamoyltransferase complex ATPase subunit type 1 TsaE [Deltaproteobacteria bacterium]|nr:tRNA (adenosine(37)-N6)-threonylcarbamoyltransferase complex ATPase subunit type 1 TsaE [Deltaproteobacteria bacterium]
MDKQELILELFDPEATLNLGRRLGEMLTAGDVVALIGDLGSGKTLLTGGLARGLGVPEDYYVTSPTFTIINEYPGRLTLYHVDLYRQEHGLGDMDAEVEEVVYGKGVAVIEWAERWLEHLPEHCIEIHLSQTGPLSRRCRIVGVASRLADLGMEG